jgi:hypothetical protein
MFMGLPEGQESTPGMLDSILRYILDLKGHQVKRANGVSHNPYQIPVNLPILTSYAF